MSDHEESTPTGGPSRFPALHPRPATGWLNDPNGPIRWRDRYHLFFQHNPEGPVHDAICWGHLSSTDLVTWRSEPVALRPTPGGPDADGCWSGCVVDDSGVATAVYTGHRAGAGGATICLAYSHDEALHHWEKAASPVASAPATLPLLGFRDPFVFSYGAARYAVVGAGVAPQGKGAVLIYRCDDLTSWTYLGVLLDTSDPVAGREAPGDIWECPQLFEMGGRWLLVISIIVEPHADRVVYLVGSLVEQGAGLRFVPDAGGLVDHGHDFYAPAVLDTGARTLLWGWSWEDLADGARPDADWAGSLTMTRELVLGPANQLCSSPVAETELLHHQGHEVVLAGPSDSTELPVGPLDLALEVTSEVEGLVTVELCDMLRLELDLVEGTVELHRAVHVAWRRGWLTQGRVRPGVAECRLRIIIDGSVVEIFVDEGPCFTERLEPSPRPELRIRGGHATRCRVVVRQLRAVAHVADEEAASAVRGNGL